MMMTIRWISNLSFFLIITCFFSCINQNSNVFTPVPDFSVFESDDNTIDFANIIENRNMPEWLAAYLTGGIAAVERLEGNINKYAFIAVNHGSNLSVLNKWAENFSAVRDFPMLAAARIENRMISAAALYPDDEYGLFFETMVKNAFSAEYPGTLKEGSHWIRIRQDNENAVEAAANYIYYILITINRAPMQATIRNLIIRSNAAVNVTAAQSHSINRLRQTFFEGF